MTSGLRRAVGAVPARVAELCRLSDMRAVITQRYRLPGTSMGLDCESPMAKGAVIEASAPLPVGIGCRREGSSLVVARIAIWESLVGRAMLMSLDPDADFNAFLTEASIRLRRALIGSVGLNDVDDAVGAALEWAWVHRAELELMENPLGYLYRVGQSKVRRRRKVVLLPADHVEIPEVEPQLLVELHALPRNERVAVWLACGCSWTHAEVAESLGVTRSTASTHVARGLARLRRRLGANL